MVFSALKKWITWNWCAVKLYLMWFWIIQNVSNMLLGSYLLNPWHKLVLSVFSCLKKHTQWRTITFESRSGWKKFVFAYKFGKCLMLFLKNRIEIVRAQVIQRTRCFVVVSIMVKYRWFMCRFLLYIDLRSGSGVDWEWIDRSLVSDSSTSTAPRLLDFSRFCFLVCFSSLRSHYSAKKSRLKRRPVEAGPTLRKERA